MNIRDSDIRAVAHQCAFVKSKTPRNRVASHVRQTFDARAQQQIEQAVQH
jgi:hypothetical protein